MENVLHPASEHPDSLGAVRFHDITGKRPFRMPSNFRKYSRWARYPDKVLTLPNRKV